MLLWKKNNKKIVRQFANFLFHYFALLTTYKIFAQGPLPLNNPPFTQGKPFSNKKSQWREINEFKSLETLNGFSPNSAQVLKDFAIDSNNIVQEFKKTLNSKKAQVFHIPFRVNLIDYKKNTSGNIHGKIYYLEGLLTWKVETHGEAFIQIQNLTSDNRSDFRHQLEIKNEIPKHLKKVFETQSEIINAILEKSLK